MNLDYIEKEWYRYSNEWWASNAWGFKKYSSFSNKIIVELNINNVFWVDEGRINMYMPFKFNKFQIQLYNNGKIT